MSIDLERSLDELARSVHDDALADRLNGQVYRMVAQIKRRRAARYTGTSVIGMSAAAAVVVGGLQLAERDGTAPVATEAPDPGPAPTCGDPGPAATEAADLVLEAQVAEAVPYGSPLPLQLFLFNVLSMSVNGYSQVAISVVQDGVVVGTAEADPVMFGLTDGVDPAVSELAVTACGGDTPLGDGDYTLVATVHLDLADGTTRTAVSEPVSFTIAGDPLRSGDENAAQQALDEVLAAAETTTESFGTCGSLVETTAVPPLALDLALDARTYAAGESFTTQVGVRATDTTPSGVLLTANAPQVVLTRDDVVVARGSVGDDAVPIDLGADGTTTLEMPAGFFLCSLPGADAPEVPLPAGTYEAYATFTLTVDDPTADDEVPWEPVVVRSEPVDVTIG